MRFPIIFTALMLVVSAARADLLSPRAFTEAAAAAARAALPSAKVDITEDLRLETRSARGETITTDLRNAYDLYRADPSDLDHIIQRYVGVLAESIRFGENKTPLDRSRIVPVLKPQRWVDGVRQGVSSSAPQILAEPYNTELAIVYAEDRLTSVRFLNTRDDVGSDRVKLFVLALGNLQRLLTNIEMHPGPDDTWMITADGNYESSLLLADQVWSSGQIKVDGEIVAAVPVKSGLFVTGSRNHAGLARLRTISSELAAGPYGLTPDLLVYRGGKFVKFDGN